jgi:hypothetical protein
LSIFLNPAKKVVKPWFTIAGMVNVWFSSLLPQLEIVALQKNEKRLDVNVICLAAIVVAASAARIGKVSVSQIEPTVQFSASARLLT